MRTAAAALVAALALAPVLALAPAAQAQTPALEVRQAWIALPPNGINDAAAYMEVVNGGRAPDRLVGASCGCAARAEVHVMDMAGGVMHMHAAPGGLPIQPAGALHLEPHGAHLMLTGLRGKLHPGQRVPITLQFAHAGRMTVEAVVR